MRLTYGYALGLGLAVIFLLPPAPAASQTQTSAQPSLGTTPLLPETGLGGAPKSPLDNPPKSSLDNPIGTPAPGPAPTPDSADIIRQIRIEGSQRIEPSTVRSYLTLQLGDRFDPDKMDESLKALFATGLYADVTLRREETTLIVHVVENPIINRIAFEGNSKVEDKTLNGEIQLKPRSVYTRTKVQEDVKRILDVYRKNGRFGATVEPKVIVQPENRVDLVYEIHEGDKTHVTRISFIGNHAFSDTRLREKVQTSEYAWWKFLSSSDTYDADRLNYDRELLRKFYLSEGYADFRVVSAVAELAPNDEGFYVTFTLDEGDRYEFGKVMVKSAVKEVDAQELADLLTIREGTWYNADLVEDGVTKISNHLGNLGYAFVDVRPRVTRNRDKRTIDILFDVQQGPRVYVERINIKGNTRTIDKVILRELQFAEGDAYSTAKIEESRRRLKNLGYFESSDISNTPGSQPDTTIVNVDVKEQPTGQISLGAGFSTYEGAIGDFGINEFEFPRPRLWPGCQFRALATAATGRPQRFRPLFHGYQNRDLGGPVLHAHRLLRRSQFPPARGRSGGQGGLRSNSRSHANLELHHTPGHDRQHIRHLPISDGRAGLIFDLRGGADADVGQARQPAGSDARLFPEI